jgi:amidophosphoribosyltransferase
MSGFFGVVSKTDIASDLFYGTDYHSHLGTKRGGLATENNGTFQRIIHDITNAQFRSKFYPDLKNLNGRKGIGIISDYEDQPLVIYSHLGTYSLVNVGVVKNADELIRKAFDQKTPHFSEMSNGEINPTELIATLINQGSSFVEGIKIAQDSVKGSSSLLVLTDKGIYASRDKFGRTPVFIGRKNDSYAVSFETSAFPNMNYQLEKTLGPGEIVFTTEDGYETVSKPLGISQICSFLWVYYGYPASMYEGRNVEAVRYACGEALAKNEKNEIDIVAGIPDSGTAHAIGFANKVKAPYKRPFVKYTPTWPRSFMPQDQTTRDLVARMKLIPIREIIIGQRILFCDDSIVRGTQLKDTVRLLFEYGAKEVHMRPACPPLVYGCKFLNFSRLKSELDLAGRKAIHEIENGEVRDPAEYIKYESDKYSFMIEKIRARLGLTSLRYQKLDDLVSAIGLKKESLCTYCWDGVGVDNK